MAAQTLLSTMSHLMPLHLLTGARCLLFSSIPRQTEMSLLSLMTALHFSMVRHYYFHTPHTPALVECLILITFIRHGV